MKILIADSGSTTTDWAVIEENKEIERFTTSGINPIYQDEDSIIRLLMSEYDKWTLLKVDSIFYYGAGCIGGDRSMSIEYALSKLTHCPHIVVESDILGAARAMCQHNRGIVSILGTGANSCLYDGGSIVYSVRPLGFILGDEGSGANIGKHIVADALKGILPIELTEKMYQWCGLSYSEIIDNIYRQPYPNRFLARFTRFASENISNPCIDKIVVDSFSDFAKRNLMLYPNCSETLIHFVGSVAFHFSEQLQRALNSYNLQIGHIVKSPLDGLIKYHS